MASSKQPEPAVEPEALPWVLLSAVPRSLAAPRLPLAGERVKDVVVELQKPPAISTLRVGRRVVPRNEDIVPKVVHPFLTDPAPSTRRYPYVAATESSGALLICASHRADRDPAPYLNWPRFFLCDAIKGTAEELPGMDSGDLLYSLDHPGRLGLIRDGAGRLLVADLQPVPLDLDVAVDEAVLQVHLSGTGKWDMVRVDRPPRVDDDSWAYHGVHAHGGRLWWCDLSYGLLSCDVFVEKPALTYTPYPEESLHPFATKHKVQIDLEKTRCVRISGDKLRLVILEEEGGGAPTVKVWSLSDLGGVYRWESDYAVNLTAITAQKKVLGEQSIVLAAVHPFKPNMIYAWIGMTILELDAAENKVVNSGEAFKISDDKDHVHVPEGEFPSSRLLHAWVTPPALQRALHDEAVGSFMGFLRSLFSAPPFEPGAKWERK